MKVIKPSYEILTPITGHELDIIEIAARTCYKSEVGTTQEAKEKFVARLIKNKHEAMLEHSSLSVRFICDRGVSHELVRHRIASFAQESTRYCNYSQDKFGNELTFIKPLYLENSPDGGYHWYNDMVRAEKTYMRMLELGYSPQEARAVLPNSLKTELIMTMNYRNWRHFFWLRAARATGPAHPQMEELARPLLGDCKRLIPVIFDDIIIPEG